MDLCYNYVYCLQLTHPNQPQQKQVPHHHSWTPVVIQTVSCGVQNTVGLACAVGTKQPVI